MIEIATVRLIGSALALFSPNWLRAHPTIPNDPGGSQPAASGDAALLLLSECFGDAGRAYLEQLSQRVANALGELGAIGADAEALGATAATLTDVYSYMGAEPPSEIRHCTDLLDGNEEADDEAVAEAASKAARWIATTTGADANQMTLICIVVATLLLSASERPQIISAAKLAPPADTATHPNEPTSNDASIIRLDDLLGRIRNHARIELQGRYTSELATFGLDMPAFQAAADAAHAGDASQLERLARATEQRIVQAAITDFANARKLSNIAASCRCIRAWGACAAGEFLASANHFKLAVRHIANEPHATRASFLTAAIDMSILASFVSKPETSLLAARDRAAELGALVKTADGALRLGAALTIGQAELAVGRGFDQVETCENVIAFAETASAEARLTGNSGLAKAADVLRCRTQLTLAIQFGQTQLLDELPADLTALADTESLSSGQVTDVAANRLHTLAVAARAIADTEAGALTLSAAELGEITGDTPTATWALVRTALDVSDRLDAAFLGLRACAATAVVSNDAGAIRTLLARDYAWTSDRFGTWLSPARRAIIGLDQADLISAIADNATDQDKQDAAQSLRTQANSTLAALGHPLGTTGGAA